MRFHCSWPAVEEWESVPTVSAVAPRFRTVPSGRSPPVTAKLRVSVRVVFPSSDVFRERKIRVTVTSVDP